MGRMRKAIKGRTVNVHYVGTLDDGTEFDSSRSRGETISFEVGGGQMIRGFDAATEGMTVGQTKSIKLSPTDAYGDVNPEAFQTVPNNAFPEDFVPETGAMVHGQTPEGQNFSARIHELQENTVTLDFNHPMAGKSLNFEIELVSVGE